MSGKFDLSDYVDVDARLRWFFATYPEGSMQSEVISAPDGFLGVKAYAYRSPEDSAPGVGHAYELFPGTTPYTRNSELMVAETSAWGRALAAIGAPTKGHVASTNEVRARTPTDTGSALGESQGEGKAAAEADDPAQPPPETVACAHKLWEDVPGREGWRRCVGCGMARKGLSQETLPVS